MVVDNLQGPLLESLLRVIASKMLSAPSESHILEKGQIQWEITLYPKGTTQCTTLCVIKASTYYLMLHLKASPPLLSQGSLLFPGTTTRRQWGNLVPTELPNICSRNQPASKWPDTGSAPPFLTLALDGGEWSVSCPGHFIPREGAWCPSDRRLGGPYSWSGHYAPAQNWTLTVQLVACCYTDWDIRNIQLII
jgi:hypothetical protein